MKISDVRELTGEQALYVLEQLVEARKVSARDVSDAVDRLHDEINQLQERLRRLQGAAARDSARAEPAGTSRRSPAPSAQRAPARKRSLSPKQKQSFALQAAYMRQIRELPKSRRSEFQKIAKEQGREKAIQAMQARKS